MFRTALIIFAISVTTASAAKIVLVAGGGNGGDGSPALQAKVITPFACDFDSKGTLVFVEMEKGERVRSLDAAGNIVTLAGTGAKGNTGDDGPAKLATFNGMHGLAITKDDAIYLADTWNNRVRVIQKDRIQAFAGTGKKGVGIVSVEARLAEFGGIFAIAATLDRTSLIITDLDNRALYSIDPQARVITPKHVAGNGKKGLPSEGKAATQQPLVDPRAAAMDGYGNVYILERSGHALRMVNRLGNIVTVAGTGKAGNSVGKALESQMNGPKHLCIDKDNSVIIADAENHRILRYDPIQKTIAVIAGTGKKGAAGVGGDPLACELNRPHGVAVHPTTGELFIVDSYNDRILKISP
jgi:DNA-binding beta-propeller fold protein YncE